MFWLPREIGRPFRGYRDEFVCFFLMTFFFTHQILRKSCGPYQICPLSSVCTLKCGSQLVFLYSFRVLFNKQFSMDTIQQPFYAHILLAQKLRQMRKLRITAILVSFKLSLPRFQEFWGLTYRVRSHIKSTGLPPRVSLNMNKFQVEKQYDEKTISVADNCASGTEPKIDQTYAHPYRKSN